MYEISRVLLTQHVCAHRKLTNSRCGILSSTYIREIIHSIRENYMTYFPTSVMVLHPPEEFLRDVSIEEEQEQRRGTEIGRIPEVMEVILSQLPISHLYGSCRLVCRKWNDIIQREKVY